MPENNSSQLLHLIGLVIGASLMLLAMNSHADNTNLSQKFAQLRTALQDNVYGIPLYIESSAENHMMQGEVYGILRHDFSHLRQALTTAANWCDIAPLHLNIKACTYQKLNSHCQLTFYSGRKFYENPEDVYQLAYRFDVLKSEPSYFQTRLASKTGPMGTSDYRIEAEAIPIDATSSFIHFSYAYHYNFFTKLGMNTYLATLGRNKVGFTILNHDPEGKPVYVQGIRGIIERNAVRYFFAIQSYLDSQATEIDKRLEARLNDWFNLTERYPLQLHEMDRESYLADKQKERQDQSALQQALFATKGQAATCATN